MGFAEEVRGCIDAHNRLGALTAILLNCLTPIIEHGTFTHLVGGPCCRGTIEIDFVSHWRSMRANIGIVLTDIHIHRSYWVLNTRIFHILWYLYLDRELR